MPFYDRQCDDCHWQAIDVMEPIYVEIVPCPVCGAPTQRAWLTHGPAEIGDETDFVQHNGTRTPIRFRYKSEFRRWMKEKGYRVNDEHVGQDPGTDKSKFSMPWTGGGKEWLANAEELAKRNGAYVGKDPDEKPFNIRWTSGEMTSQDVTDLKTKMAEKRV